MPKNEDGEFELILGNKQLLSVFFIVVILLGVFFTMGYLVGRHSSPVAPTETAQNEPKPAAPDTSTKPGPASGQPAASATTTATAAPSSTPASTTPAIDNTKPTTAPPPPPPAPKETAPAPAPAAASPVPDEPAPNHWYLQVSAVARNEAQVEVEVLGKRGFHAIYVQIPDHPAIYRVLVGPYAAGDTGAVNQARADLQKVGLKGYDAILRKY
jgi:cell division septation protein DedD